MGFLDAFSGIFSTKEEREKEKAKNKAAIEAIRKKAVDIIKSYEEKCLFTTFNFEYDIYLTDKRVLMVYSRIDKPKDLIIEMMYKDIDYI